MLKRALNVLWRRRTLDLVPESYFIVRVLLGELGRPVRVIAVEHLADAPFLDNVLVVSMKTEFAGYIAEARRRGMHNLMLLHLGDEQATDDRGFYSDANLVLRNYWFEAIMAERKVVWVPNGYAIGVGPVALNARLRSSQRSAAGFFAGALGMRVLSSERQQMKAAVQRAALPFELRSRPHRAIDWARLLMPHGWRMPSLHRCQEGTRPRPFVSMTPWRRAPSRSCCAVPL
jgi:hypothetical protein